MPGVGKTLDEYKAGKLHSGSKHGPVVKSKAQALAIGLSEQRKEGKHVAKPKHEPHHEATAPGHMGKVHDHDAEQGHMTRAPKHAERDGAGRGGHDMEMHHRTEHKSPTHPEGQPHGSGIHPGRMRELLAILARSCGWTTMGHHCSATITARRIMNRPN